MNSSFVISRPGEWKLFSVEDNDEILDLSDETKEAPRSGCAFPDCALEK